MVHENRKEDGLSPEGEAMLILKKNLESYQSLVENMPDPIARFNRELQFVYANKAFLKNMGLPAFAILGKTSRDFEFPESMVMPSTSLLQKVFETGEAAEMQTYFPLDDGDIYMLTKIVPEWNEHGAVETVLAIGCDMTNEKKAEQEILRLREEVAQKTTDKYQAILNSIDDGFVFCQLLRNEQGEAIDYRYLDFNAAFQKQRGLPVDYFAGRTVREVYPGNHRPSLEIYEKAVNTNQPVRTEIFHSDNWYELTAYPFKEDYFSVIFRNIDQRKKTEQQLAEAEKTYKLQLEQEVAERTFELSESQHQYASLVENTPDVITRWDKDLKLIFANSAFASKTGIDLEELHGKTNLEMGLPQEIAISYMNSLQKVFETGQPLEHFHAFPTPHGEVYYFSRIVPEKNEQGEVQTVLRIARDITHIKKTEEEILGLKDEVAQKATDKYMTLFNTMEEGFLVIELIRDEAGKCIDYCFLEVNPAFEKLIGIKPADALGRTVLEIFPTLDPWWLEMYGEIGAKGESTRFEQHLKENDRWYESFVYPTMWDQQLAVLYKDITERKRHEQSQALLSTISKELVELTTIDETVQRLGEKIGQHFGVSWCMFAEIDQEHPVTTYGWNVEEVASIKGTYRVRDYLSAEQVANNNAGIQSIVRDTELEPHSSAESVKKLGIRSFIGTPLVRNQKWCFTLSIMHTEPRQWREDEIELIQEIASRIWTRLERAHAEEELRINKERTQAQKEAFQATINGASLEESLNILARMVTVELGSKVQTAFFLASPDNVHLLAIHGAGDMIDSYKKQIDGFPIGLHSFGCGLAMATGQPVLTPDIYAEPLWHNHIALAEEGSFRAVGSFPIKTREGTQVGTFAMYFSDIQEFTPQILTLADAVTQAAAFILSHNAEVQERARVEAALRQSEERLIITMESATDYAIITTDPDGIIERWSGGASKIFLYSEEEAKGKPINIIFTEEDRDAGISQKEMAVARNLGHATHGRWHQRKDGTRFFVSGVMRPIYNPTLTGYVKVVRDATQEQLFTEELHRLVAERTDELQRSNEDLRQFAHVASHDLKEPVRKIKIFQNRITDEYSDTLPEKVKVYLSKMENATDRMFSMIEGVLKYSKLGDSEQTEEWVNLNEVIGDISTDLELLMQQKNARLHTNNLPVLTGFKVLLYQLFYNLILNSLKFSKAGVPAQIEINAEEVMEDNQPFYKIIVSDNGIGFEATNAEKIFITFTKLNPANEYEGTGLGLALCKKIVLRHGGTISATGVPNQGATFTILLPAR